MQGRGQPKAKSKLSEAGADLKITLVVVGGASALGSACS